MEDRYAYERALLRYMLTIRTREGQPVVWAETLLREFVEDLGAGLQCYEGDPAEIAAWAMGTGEGMGSEPQRLSCQIDVAYRTMVGAFSWGFHPDWLCVPPSPRLGHPRFPAWDWHGRQVV
jgi:hypothetical protein